MQPEPTRRDLLRAGAAVAAAAAVPLTAATTASAEPQRPVVQESEILRAARKLHADAQTWKAPEGTE